MARSFSNEVACSDSRSPILSRTYQEWTSFFTNSNARKPSGKDYPRGVNWPHPKPWKRPWGEAWVLRQMAEEEGWSLLSVVASPFHIPRKKDKVFKIVDKNLKWCSLGNRLSYKHCQAN